MTSSLDELKKLCRLVRYDIVTSTTAAGSGHPSSSLSAVEIMTTLFFGGFLRCDLNDPKNPANDRFVLSKGHASPLLYSLYHAAGTISQSELMSLRRFGSPLEGHPTPDFKYVDVATGSLGQGLSVGVGMALGIKLKFEARKLPRVYVLLGDSEMAEGQNWEAMEIASHFKLDNLIGVLDVNRLGQRGETMLGWDIKTYQKRIESFGWKTIVVEDGHDLKTVNETFKQTVATARHLTESVRYRPVMIICKTIKGKGVSFMENKEGWHGKPVPKELLDKALKDIGEVHMEIRGKIEKPNFPHFVPLSGTSRSRQISNEKKLKSIRNKLFLLSQRVEDANSFATWDVRSEPKANEQAHGAEKSCIETRYKFNDLISTREAFGSSITKIGKTLKNLIVLDGEVANSTYTEKFHKEFPDRFFEMFIAEQNMVTAAVGISKINFIPLVSTFAAFFTRAFDQIRMASYSRANVKFVGTHAGVFIGADGPSQMGLEDISMMRSVNGSVVLYPSDAVSAEKLVEKMLDTQGICYLRATRDKTPVIYENDEEFKIGGSKIHKSEVRSSKLEEKTPNPKPQNPNKKVLIIAAGITLHEALKAQKVLTKRGIKTIVLDCYSIKPLDEKTILNLVTTINRLIVVEDHYQEGGLGEAVSQALLSNLKLPASFKFIHLAVRKLPRSGTQKELLQYEGIDEEAIIKASLG